jgi:putative alpha-1,2-mannosidase
MKVIQIKLAVLLLLSLFVFSTKASNSSKVNLFIGTSGDNGQVSPGACVPFGMVNVCPDSHPRTHAGYDYSIDRVSGISINRVSGVGCSGAGGNLSIKPTDQDMELMKIQSSEKAFPGYYETQFNNGVKAELTATGNVALERFLFAKNSEAMLTINFGASFEKIIDEQHTMISNNEIEGYLISQNVCGRGKYKLFFHFKSNFPFNITQNKDRKAVLVFDNKNKQVEIRIAVSSVGIDEARAENNLIATKSFSQVKKEAARLWEDKLSKITVKGNPEEQTLFYTSLYRVYQSPAKVSSHNGKYLATDGQIKSTNNIPYYSSWSLWDTYRTKFPLLVITEPEAMSHMAQSLVRLYQSGKVNWSTDSEATPTVRTEHAVLLLLDAHRKGIKGIDFEACYPQLCKEAAELPMGSPDQKLESSADLWALSQIAEIIGKQADAEKYQTQSEVLFSETWKKEFMTIDPTFVKMGGNGLYQGTRWQYRWAVPQYLHKMIEWSGKDSLRAQLTQFFDLHLFNQGNEPDIHVPFLFNKLELPEKTSETVFALLTQEIIHKYGGNAEFKTPYVGRAFKNAPEGYMPEMDEDDGTMGAWYVFSSMGLYPLTIGEPEYELSSPLFDQITIKTENGKTFRIKTVNRKKLTDPVKEIRLNGNNINTRSIKHQDITSGSMLEFLY